MGEGIGPQVEAFMSNFLERSRLELQMELEESDRSVEIRLSGRDSELVLDNGARLLDAVNDIVNQVFFHKTGSRVEIDCDDYRLTRMIELELLARNAAEKARQSGRSIRFQPMTASERRTIHLTLAEEAGVRTESTGTGPRRHVVVWPDA